MINNYAHRWTLNQLYRLEESSLVEQLPPLESSLCISFWLHPDNRSDIRVLLSQGEPELDGKGWRFFLDGDRLIFRVVAGGTSGELWTKPEDIATWTHIAGIIDREAGRIIAYRDGSADNWQAGSNGATLRGPLRLEAPLIIGGYTDPAGGHFDYTFGRGGNGRLDDVRLYRRALQANEITQFLPADTQPPDCRFSFSVSSANAPALLHASAITEGNDAIGYFWEFGDERRAFGPTVEHTYSYSGTYTLKLTVLGANHVESATEQTISVGGEANPLVFTPVFVNGTEGHACYRIPSIVRANNGDLLAFAEGRVESCSDSTHTIHIVMKRSSDNGATWMPLQIVGRNVVDGVEYACNNCSPVVDERTGRIVVLFNQAETSEWELARGLSNARLICALSDDNGHTWRYNDITEQVHRPNNLAAGITPAAAWRVQRPTLGHGLQLARPPHQGRLVHAGMITVGERSVFESQNYIFWSDDNGESWRIGGVAPEIGLNEATVAELENGDLLINSRAYSDEKPRGYRAVTIAHFDDDRVTFSDTNLDAALIDPAVQASLLRYSWSDDAAIGNRSRLLFSNPAHPRARLNLTARLSYDEGRTWPVARVIDPGPSSYSDLVVQKDGKIGVLYERGNHGGIWYVSFTLDWLTGGQDPGPAST